MPITIGTNLQSLMASDFAKGFVGTSLHRIHCKPMEVAECR